MVTRKVTRISDAGLVKRCRSIKDLEVEAEKINRRVADLKAEVLEEMERRGTKTFENGGVRITRAQGSRWQYDWAAISSVLNPRQRKLIYKRVPDPNGLKAATTSGQIPPELVADYMEEIPNKAYVVITPVTS